MKETKITLEVCCLERLYELYKSIRNPFVSNFIDEEKEYFSISLKEKNGVVTYMFEIIEPTEDELKILRKILKEEK
jgi:hypothetical protein